MEPLQLYRAKVAISVFIYVTSVSMVPIYNKKVFSGTVCWGHSKNDCAKAFPYPITTAFLQLGFVSLLLTVASVVGHFASRKSRELGHSWIFGPHFMYKLQHIAPVGVLFGVKYGITNWGLALVPTAKHLLLQSTDLVWTVIFARVINKERLGFLEVVAATLSVIGAVFISLAAGGELQAPALGLSVNLLTPIFLALCITTLRTGAAEIFRKDNCLKGTMNAGEFTAIKLALSSSVALLLSFILENHAMLGVEKAKQTQSWWDALAHYPLESLALLFCGGFFVLIFQVNITWLAGLTSAIAVGIVGEVKVLPQWLFNAMFELSVDLSPFNIVGAILSLCGSILYAVASSLSQELLLTRQGLEWRPKPKTNESLLGVGSQVGIEAEAA